MLADIAAHITEWTQWRDECRVAAHAALRNSDARQAAENFDSFYVNRSTLNFTLCRRHRQVSKESIDGCDRLRVDCGACPIATKGRWNNCQAQGKKTLHQTYQAASRALWLLPESANETVGWQLMAAAIDAHIKRLRGMETTLTERIRAARERAYAEAQAKPMDIFLSHSNDGLFESCPRKFEFISIYKRVPPPESRVNEESEALRVGSVMHEAAQAWFRARHMGVANPLDAAYYTLALHWDFDKESRVRPLGAAAELLRQMSKDSYWNDWQLMEIDGFGPAIEVPFRIQHVVPDLPARYRLFTQGKIDLILRNTRTGEVRCHDFKTTTQPLHTWGPLYTWSDQGAFYGLPIQQVTKTPVGSQMNVTYYMLSFSTGSRDAEFYDSEQTLPTDFLAVKPLVVTYDQQHLQEFMTIKRDRIDRLVKYLRRGEFPRATHGCVTWNKPCYFFGVCHSRDAKWLHEWFEFESWESKARVYDPVWTFEDNNY